MGLLIETVCAAISVVVLCIAMATHPSRASCPRGAWYVNGVRPSGVYECRRVPLHEDDPDPPGVVYGRIYCTGGHVPIVNIDTGRAVGCQP